MSAGSPTRPDQLEQRNSMFAIRSHATRLIAGGFFLLAGFLSGCETSPASGADAPALSASELEAQTSIPFASRGGIANWQPVDQSHLLIEDNRRQWYLVTLQSPSWDLAFTNQIAFDPSPSGALERFSTVLIKGVPYRIISVVRTDPPGKSKK